MIFFGVKFVKENLILFYINDDKLHVIVEKSLLINQNQINFKTT